LVLIGFKKFVNVRNVLHYESDFSSFMDTQLNYPFLGQGRAKIIGPLVGLRSMDNYYIEIR